MHRLTRLTWAVLVWFVPLLSLLGCAMHKEAAGYGGYGDYGPDAAAMEEAEYGGYGDSGGGDATVYYFDEDDAAGEVLSPEGANLSSRGRSRHSSMVQTRGTFNAELGAEEAPAPAKPAPSSGTEVDVPKPPEDAPRPQASAKRQIIYTATMQVSVYDVAGSIAIAESLPDRFGGWVHQRVDSQLVLRIPAGHLDEAMRIIAELGVVDYRLLEALDVTAQYTDLESRIRVLREMKAQLELLLKKAKDVEQALEIRKALDQITMELELAEAHMRELAKSIAFSTLVVRIIARGPEHDIPSSNDPFPWVIELGVEATEYR